MIRPATAEDYHDILLFLTAQPQLTSVFKSHTETKMKRVFIMSLLHGFVYVVEKHRQIIGFFMGSIRENQWGRQCAFDLVNCSTAQTPQLLRLFYQWAKQKGAQDILLSNSFGSERLDRLITTLGFTLETKSYIKEIV